MFPRAWLTPAVLWRFLQVGGIGFAIDAGLLWVFVYALGIDPLVARVGSFAATIVVTFLLNARYTFRVPIQSASKPHYVVIQCVGAGLNFLTYSWLVLAGPLHSQPLLALVVGSALASTHNYLMMRRFVF